jgi:hypothetical protein
MKQRIGILGIEGGVEIFWWIISKGLLRLRYNRNYIYLDGKTQNAIAQKMKL